MAVDIFAGLPLWELLLIYAGIIWSLVWMGLGMWKASKNNAKVWFVVFLLVHTLGILEILYIYVFSKRKR
jgi:hypothetical protein